MEAQQPYRKTRLVFEKWKVEQTNWNLRKKLCLLKLINWRTTFPSNRLAFKIFVFKNINIIRWNFFSFSNCLLGARRASLLENSCLKIIDSSCTKASCVVVSTLSLKKWQIDCIACLVENISIKKNIGYSNNQWLITCKSWITFLFMMNFKQFVHSLPISFSDFSFFDKLRLS